MNMTKNNLRRPPWFKVTAFGGDKYHDVRKRLRGLTLHTVCEEANCPNRGECFNAGTASFLLLGPKCTRNCRFCDIASGKPNPLDPTEPVKVAEMVEYLDLSHVVLTSVTRDDLPDQGSRQFARTVAEIKRRLPQATTEILTPDFHARPELIDLALSERPTVFNHNVETIPRLYPEARPQSEYKRSLRVLEYVIINYPIILVKSGIMVGLGETVSELNELFADLAAIKVKVLTIGQYLSPSKQHAPVRKYYTPEEFSQFAIQAENSGIEKVISGPLVRSSYRAHEVLQ
ncbi:MAG: lipoyl synthase [candidate division Zixibacteria bacterium]